MGLGKIFNFLASNGSYGRTEAKLEGKINNDLRRADLDKEKSRLIRHEKNRKEKVAEISEKLKGIQEQRIELEFKYVGKDAEHIEKLKSMLEEREQTTFSVSADDPMIILAKCEDVSNTKPAVTNWVKKMCNVGHVSRCAMEEWNVLKK